LIARARRVPAWAVLVTLVVASTVLRSVAAWRVDGPWITPDEIIYTLLGRSLWQDGTLSILGADTGFYTLLYPLLVGLPLGMDDLETGRRILQVVQALVMSATAVPVYLWARRLVHRRWALAAAALTLALPSLGYSAVVMSETLYLPLATVALWALARALERPTAGRQLVLAVAVALAVATRLQALVFVPVFVTAVVLKAWLDRDREVLRSFAPALALIGVAAVTVAVVARSGALGAYSVAAEGSYDAVRALRFIGYHGIGVVVLSGVVPALALVFASLPSLRGRETSAAARAFVAVALAYPLWLAVEVGVFASRHIGHLAGRDLLTAAPLLFLGLALWLDRGAPRPQPAASIVAFAAAGAALLLPIRSFASGRTVQDVLELAPFIRLAPTAREVAFAVAVAAGAALFALVPRRSAWLAAAVLGAALTAASVVAAGEIDRQESLRQAGHFERSPTWVDDAGESRVAYLYAGEPRWTGVWRHLYWNRSIDLVWSLAGRVPGPVPQALVVGRADGTLLDRDGPVRATAVVAPTEVTLFGEPVATNRQRGMRAAGLVLWRTPDPPRVSTISANVLANGDLIGGAAVRAYACGAGRLELTLLGKSDLPVSLRLDGITRQVVELRSGEVWRGAVETQPYATEDGTCLFELASDGLVGSTRIEFIRR
jgi:hypothetical protein